MCHPAVDDATVTGFHVKGIGHLPRAYVVIKKGHSVTADEILTYANARYAITTSRRFAQVNGRLPRSGPCIVPLYAVMLLSYSD